MRLPTHHFIQRKKWNKYSVKTVKLLMNTIQIDYFSQIISQKEEKIL